MRRIFSGQLRRERIEPLLLPLQPRLARPSALERVLDVNPQATEPISLQVDDVLVVEGIETAVVGAGRQNVPRLQRVDRAHPFD